MMSLPHVEFCFEKGVNTQSPGIAAGKAPGSQESQMGRHEKLSRSSGCQSTPPGGAEAGLGPLESSGLQLPSGSCNSSRAAIALPTLRTHSEVEVEVEVEVLVACALMGAAWPAELPHMRRMRGFHTKGPSKY